MSSSTGQTSTEPETTAVPSRPPVSEEAVLEVLQEFEEGLESLRSLYQQRMTMSARLADREAEMEKEARRLSAAHGELKKSAAEVESLRRSVEESRREIEHASQEIARSRQEAEKTRLEVERSRQEAEKSRAEIDGSRQELDRLSGEMTAREAELTKTREALEVQRRSLEAAVEQLGQREAALAARAAEQDTLKTRIVELERAGAEANSALAVQQAKAAEQEVVLRREIERVMKSRDEASKSAAGNGEAERALKAEVEASRARLTAQQGAIEEHTKALAAERAEKQRLARELASAQAAPAKGSSGGDKGKLEKAAKALVELRAERDAMAARAEQLKKELEGARKAGAPSSGGTGPGAAALELRRSRLKRYRQLVHEQSLKVLKATETLKSRFEHAEKLNAQREQLAEANEKIKIAQRRIEGQRSKAKTAALVFYSLGAALVLAVVTWTVTGWVTPGTYVASAVVTAQGRGRTLNAAELGEWQSFHQQLINDPRFHEVVAERMARRGLSSLATAGAVRDLVANSVNTRSAEDGELVIELRGDGPDRTARVLETLTTALASQANAARQQRVDGAVTTIKQAAQAGTDPIDSTRLVWAAVSWLVSLCLTGVGGWLVWKRMTGTKASFEKSSAIDEALDESKWVPPAMATQMRRDRRMLP